MDVHHLDFTIYPYWDKNLIIVIVVERRDFDLKIFWKHVTIHH